MTDQEGPENYVRLVKTTSERRKYQKEREITVSITAGARGEHLLCAVFDDTGRMLSVKSLSITRDGEYFFSFPTENFTRFKVMMVDRLFTPLCQAAS